jgi:predicted transcriptional regulator
MPIIMKQIVFTKTEISEITGISRNTTSNIINKLIELGIVEPDTTVLKKGYRYKEIYNVFIGKN